MRNGTLFEEIYEGLINDSHNLTVEKDGNEYIQKRKLLRDKQSLEIKQLKTSVTTSRFKEKAFQ